MEEKNRNEESEKKPRGSFFRIVHAVYRKKWRFAGALGIILILICLTIVIEPFWTKEILDQKASVVPGTYQGSVSRIEEKLEPFFVPLPVHSGGAVARLDILASWDRSTSIRFRKNAPLIRNKIHQYLMSFSKGGKDFQREGSLLEFEIGQLIRRSLGLKDIEIRLAKVRLI